MLILKNEKEISQKELVKKVGIQPATLTVMIKRMQESGVIEKMVDKSDKRSYNVKLTEKGKTFAEKAYNQLKASEKEFLKNFSKEEEEEFFNFLKRIEQNLTKTE